MKFEKIFGFILIIIGLIFIFYSIYSMFNIFSGSSNPPKIIKMNNVELSIPLAGEVEILSGEEISKIANMSLYSIFMFFIISAGSRIADLEIKLLKIK
jgi:hypothetical protein